MDAFDNLQASTRTNPCPPQHWVCRRGGGNGLGGHIPKLSLTRVGGHGRGLERRPPCCLGMTSPLSDVARLAAAYRASGRPVTLGRIPSFAVAKGPRDAEAGCLTACSSCGVDRSTRCQYAALRITAATDVPTSGRIVGLLNILARRKYWASCHSWVCM